MPALLLTLHYAARWIDPDLLRQEGLLGHAPDDAPRVLPRYAVLSASLTLVCFAWSQGVTGPDLFHRSLTTVQHRIITLDFVRRGLK
jgi:hypothetical protein